MPAAALLGGFEPRSPLRRRPGTTAIVASVMIHGGVIALMLANAYQKPEPLPEYKVYRVDIYSPPPQVEGEPTLAKAQPAIVKPPEQKTVAVEKKPAPTTKTVAPKKTTTGVGKSDIARGRNADPRSLVGGEGLDVHMAGDAFPYPDYLENIIRQLNRYFRWDGAPNLVARIGFEIMRDGSVKNIRVLQRSGNVNFDVNAVSAVEAVGKSGAFGALPRGWVADRLAINFRFEPVGR